MCAACMVDDIELVLLPINLLQTEMALLLSYKWPTYRRSIQDWTSNKVRSCRLSQTYKTRSRFHGQENTDSNIESFRSMNIGETKALGSQIRSAYTGNCLRKICRTFEQHFRNNNRMYRVYFALDNALRQPNYLPTSSVQQKVTVMLCVHNIEGV